MLLTLLELSDLEMIRWKVFLLFNFCKTLVRSQGRTLGMKFFPGHALM